MRAEVKYRIIMVHTRMDKHKVVFHILRSAS